LLLGTALFLQVRPSLSHSQATTAFDLNNMIMDSFQAIFNQESEHSIKWPDSFEMTLSTDDPGINVTEKLYVVSQPK